MIYIVTAMYAEAHPFITRFQLKKDISHTRFQVFLNGEGSLCLIISGTGCVPAASAVSRICTKYRAGSANSGDFLVNAGVCAQIWNNDIGRAENPFQQGTVFLCNKISELATGKTFYPDILYRHGFREAQIITGAKPFEKAVAPRRAEKDFYLYDMEAAAIYQAGSYFFGPHRMSFLKIASDDGNSGSVTPSQIGHLISRNMESMAEYLTRLQSAALKEDEDGIFQDDSMQREMERLCLDLHCSRTMAQSLWQYIRYCILSGVDYPSVLKEMYREGKLPCRDKREGKQCFEELRKRLL